MWLVSLIRMEVFSGYLSAVLAVNFEFTTCHKQKYLVMIVSMETVCVVKSGPTKSQSESWDLPRD